MKEENIILRIEPDTKEKFQNICEKHNTTMAASICSFIYKEIEKEKNIINYNAKKAEIKDNLERNNMNVDDTTLHVILNSFIPNYNSIKSQENMKKEYMNFGEALVYLKQGKRIARETWHSSSFIVTVKNGFDNNIRFHLNGKATSWFPTHEDLLAEDYWLWYKTDGLVSN